MITEAAVKLIDRSNMYDILKNFDAQLNDAASIGSNIEIPSGYSGIDKIIISGMGGSAIGGDLLRSFVIYNCKLPVFVNRNYFLPEFADENTLVIVSSYSGNTEESLSAYEDAVKRRCRIICISSGGNLSALAKGNGNVLITVPAGFQPRCAIAYLFVPMLYIMSAMGFISDMSNVLKDAVNFISFKTKSYSSFDENENPALKIAEHLQGKIPVIYSSNDLLDIVNLRWRCQAEENAKKLAYGNFLPEMNHNEIVGWEANPEILKSFAVIFLNDKDDNMRIKKRAQITKELVKPYAGLVYEISSEGHTKLERILDLVHLGDWVSFFMAVLNKTDPAPIEKINILKTKLTEL